MASVNSKIKFYEATNRVRSKLENWSNTEILPVTKLENMHFLYDNAIKYLEPVCVHYYQNVLR